MQKPRVCLFYAHTIQTELDLHAHMYGNSEKVISTAKL